jgi:hypothetical protein
MLHHSRDPAHPSRQSRRINDCPKVHIHHEPSRHAVLPARARPPAASLPSIIYLARSWDS